MEGARSRTVGDKYWQITAEDGETPNHGPFAQQAKNHNYLILHATEFLFA